MNGNIYSYRYSSLLLKFLLLATLTFFAVSIALYYKESKVEQGTTIQSGLGKKFSDSAVAPDVIKAYPFDAKVIHDIEAYPALKNLLAKAPSVQRLSQSEIESELAQVRLANKDNSEFGKTHVYSSSYYIGNLLIAPNLTLHAVLAAGDRPQTSVLLETILADVRAGVVKLQNYYDVAPPGHYDVALDQALYFKTASFPNLTTAEAAIVLMVLAEIDKDNARVYEQFLHQYANQVLASGAGFASDIDFALLVAEAYIDTAKNNETYQDLFNKASLEWREAKTLSLEDSFVKKFRIGGFSYPTNFSIEATSTVIQADELENRKESIDGSLMLSLIDERLPEPTIKLYQYGLTTGLVLPYAVDLSVRQYPALLDSIAGAAYLSEDSYVFTSGTSNNHSTKAEDYFATNKLLFKNGEKLMVVNDDQSIKYEPSLNLNKDKFLYTRISGNESSIHLGSINLGNTFSESEITKGEKPKFTALLNNIILVRENDVLMRDMVTNEEQLITRLQIPEGKFLYKDIALNESTDRLLVTYSYLKKGELVPQSVMQIFSLTKAGNQIKPELISEILINDSVIYGGELSPGGDFAGILASETLTERNPRLLIFDVMSGIIKKDFSLTTYATKFMKIDGWVPF